jgi:hypothetical protein
MGESGFLDSLTDRLNDEGYVRTLVKQGLLEGEVASESEAVKVDYRRRCNQARAVSEAMKRQWPDFDKKKEWKDRFESWGPRLIWFAVLLPLVGGALQWLLEVKFDVLNYAALVIVGGLVAFMIILNRLWDETMHRQEDYQYRWLTSGATNEQFRRMKKHLFVEPEFAETEESNELFNYWLNVKHSILCEARGWSTPYEDPKYKTKYPDGLGITGYVDRSWPENLGDVRLEKDSD